MTFLPNVTQEDFIDGSEQVSYEGTTFGSVFTRHNVKAPKNNITNQFIVRAGAIPTGEDIRFYDQYDFIVATDEGSEDITVGTIELTYEVWFSIPRPAASATVAGAMIALNGGEAKGITNTTPFGAPDEVAEPPDDMQPPICFVENCQCETDSLGTHCILQIPENQDYFRMTQGMLWSDSNPDPGGTLGISVSNVEHAPGDIQYAMYGHEAASEPTGSGPYAHNQIIQDVYKVVDKALPVVVSYINEGVAAAAPSLLDLALDFVSDTALSFLGSALLLSNPRVERKRTSRGSKEWRTAIKAHQQTLMKRYARKGACSMIRFGKAGRKPVTRKKHKIRRPLRVVKTFDLSDDEEEEKTSQLKTRESPVVVERPIKEPTIPITIPSKTVRGFSLFSSSNS